MTLYELSEEYLVLQEMMYDPDTDPQVLQDTAEGILGEIEDKADGYAKIIKSMTADAEALKKEEDRLHARRKAIEGRAKWLKDTLEANMRAIGKTKFKTALFSFSIQKNGGLEPLVIDWNVEDIPGRYLVQQPPLPDTNAIRNLLATREVEWAHLEPRGESLRIR